MKHHPLSLKTLARASCYLVALIFVLSCNNQPQRTNPPKTTKIDTSKPKEPSVSIEPTTAFDTTFIVFADSAYQVNIHSIPLAESNEYEEDSTNTTLTLYHSTKNKREIQLQTQLHCQRPRLLLEDMNGDDVPDLMVYHGSGARANMSYYLCICDAKHHQLHQVKGFEQVANPGYDSVNHVITSINLSGTNTYSFYKISKSARLIDLGISYEDDGRGDRKYERAMKKRSAGTKGR